jgi:hypothetical protein
MIGQLLPNTNEMLQCILVHQSLDLNTAILQNQTDVTTVLSMPCVRVRDRERQRVGGACTRWVLLCFTGDSFKEK